MIEVSVGENDRVEFAIAEGAEVRERFLPLLFRMHAGIEDETLPGRFQVITVRADLGAAREIDELQIRLLLLLLLLLLLRTPVCRRVLFKPSAQTVHQTDQHRDNFQQLLFARKNCVLLK